MNVNKDYYATLGLTPSADSVVLRAAFKALAQRYHPDKSGIDRDQASERMAEINEAYRVLSDPATRTKYDQLREKTTQNADTAFADSDTEPTAGSPLDADWKIAVQFYPELKEIRLGLARISWKLAESFRARLLKTKEFVNARTLAAELENEFLALYFGANPKTLDFGKSLILDGRRDAARDLNRAIRILGHGAEPDKVIAVIRSKYDLPDTGAAWRYDTTGKRRGVRAQRFASENGMVLMELLERIRNREVPGFIIDGIFYVEIDEHGKPLPLNRKPVRVTRASANVGSYVLIGLLFVSVIALFFLISSYLF
ncbi:J domain-containing protein [uncultured Lamprocystis sp.]|jgi:hypothetical protein|uniref:J domain-containing protein n=1 Tax=uncultured Lamprocystis sp. TaxID=543132 RepID=UPI0025F5B7F4|nr:J domain-containing protein [uncultured Lamprocystis sp.]